MDNPLSSFLEEGDVGFVLVPVYIKSLFWNKYYVVVYKFGLPILQILLGIKVGTQLWNQVWI